MKSKALETALRETIKNSYHLTGSAFEVMPTIKGVKTGKIIKIIK